MNDKNSIKRMTSIARKIHAGYWFKGFWAIIRSNLLIALIILVTYCGICNTSVEKANNGEHMSPYWISRHVSFEKEDNRLYYRISDHNNKEWSFDIFEDLTVLAPGVVVLLGYEAIGLLFGLVGAGSVRRKLKPLNDLAVKAEEVSRMDFDDDRFRNLEQAIDNVSPNALDAGIKTGDSELQSIEVAINRLIQRMKDAQIAQSRFVSDASHELRTPIAVIQGYVNMLDRWGKEDENILEESIEALKSESDHMKELVDQLLFLARGDSGRNTLNMVEIDLNELMYEVYDESVMIDTEHQYTYKGSPMPCKINGDVAMLKQSARILIQNAAKYSDSDAEIKIGVTSDGNKVSFYIQDEGIGMSDAEVSHVFERFYRSDEARNSETGGSGLGLAIAKWIVDAHDGTISIVSSPDIGTRFTVTL